VDEGFVNSAADLDVVSIFGYGFPAYRGGIMKYGEQFGWKKVQDKLSYYGELLGKQDPQIKAFFAPSSALKKLASK
jgi:3-hydroxyacyl-CoA dehydrogenase